MLNSIASSWCILIAVLSTSACAPKAAISLTVDAAGDFTTPPEEAMANVTVDVTYPGSCDGRAFECSDLSPDPDRSTFEAGQKAALTKLAPVSDPPKWQATIMGYPDIWGVDASFAGTEYSGAIVGKTPWPSPSLDMPSLQVNQPATISWTPAVIPVPDESDHSTIIVTAMTTGTVTFTSQASDIQKNGTLTLPPSAFPFPDSYEILFRRETTLKLTMDPSLDLSVATFKVELTTQVDVAP